MIERLSVSNYRSLGENVDLELGPFTALVGPNGSGKSNVVDVLRFVSDCMHMGLSGAISSRNGIGAVRRWSGGHPFNVKIALELALDGGHPVGYSFELKGDTAEEYRVKWEAASVSGTNGHFSFVIEDGEWLGGPEGLAPSLDGKSLALPIIGGDARFQPLVQALQQISVLSIFPDALRVPQKYSPVKPMDGHGSNWASILKDQPRDSWKPELIGALEKLTNDIEDIKVSQAASYLVVQFRHASRGRPKWFDAAQESDGTLRVAGIVTALLQEPPVPLIGIEEPELTVHPGAIPLLFDFLKQASRRSQVLITTHSPELLDQMEAEEVRVVLRGQDGTTVAPMAASQREAVREGLLTLGEVLRTEGLQPELPLAGVG
ncbi:MAG: AAA family ATPase [Thermoanaerobaculia bacterium]